MRAPVLFVPLCLCFACGQPLDHPKAAPACDPQVMKCAVTNRPAAGGPGGGNQGGAGTDGEQLATFTGDLRVFDDDYFVTGKKGFFGKAEVSATGESGARIATTYDGASFELAGVLKEPANWFLAVPEAGSGMLPTLMPIDTRSATADGLAIGVAQAADVEAIFLASSGTERAAERAQIALRVVDAQQRSIAGVTGTLTAEVTSYRAGGSWVGVTSQNETDESGMIFFGNVPGGSALSRTNINLSGAVKARVEALTRGGAISVLTVVVSP